MNFFIASALINVFLAGLLGFVVILKNRKELINKLFFCLTLSVIFWATSYWQWLSSDNADSALFFARLLSIGSLFIPIFYFHWILVFTNLNKQKGNLIKFLYFVGFIFLIFSFSGLFIKNVETKFIFSYWPNPGILYHLYLIFIYFGLAVYSLIILLNQYGISSGIIKSNIKYIIFGSLVGFGGGLTNFFLWYNIPIFPYGNILVSFYPIALALASLRYGLFNIKVIATELLVFALWVFLLINILLNENFWNKLINGTILALSIIFGILIIKSVLQEVSQKDKFKELSEELEKLNFQLKTKTIYLTALQDFTADITQSLDFKIIIQKIVDEIPSKLGYVAALLFLISEDGERISLSAISSNKATRIGLRILSKPASEYFAKMKEDKILVVEAVNKNSIQISEKFSDFIAPPVPKTIVDLIQKTVGIKSAVGIPVKSGEKIIGTIVILFNKEKEKISQDELEVMQALANQVGIVFKNISLYEQIKIVNRKLEEIDKLKAEMYSFVSHQIKAPIGIVKGFAQLLYDGSYGKIPKKAKETTVYIKTACDRLINLAETFLNLRRIEEGKMDYEFKEVNIVDLIKSIVEEIKLLAEQKKLDLRFNLRTSDVLRTSDIQKIVVKADEIRLRQVIQNLIENAIKYTPKGFVRVDLRLTTNDQRQQSVLFTVSDSGIGINSKVLPELFDQFKRAKETRQIQGTGLGLYIAREIVKAHNGEIWAESEGEGKGSRFYVRLGIVGEIKS